MSLVCSFLYLCLLASQENWNKTTYANVWWFLHPWVDFLDAQQSLLDALDWTTFPRICRWCLFQLCSTLYWGDCFKRDSRYPLGYFSIKCYIWYVFRVHFGIRKQFICDKYCMLCNSCCANYRIRVLS